MKELRSTVRSVTPLATTPRPVPKWQSRTVTLCAPERTETPVLPNWRVQEVTKVSLPETITIPDAVRFDLSSRPRTPEEGPSSRMSGEGATTTVLWKASPCTTWPARRLQPPMYTPGSGRTVPGDEPRCWTASLRSGKR